MYCVLSSDTKEKLPVVAQVGEQRAESQRQTQALMRKIREFMKRPHYNIFPLKSQYIA
jgi:hypothetical protein